MKWALVNNNLVCQNIISYDGDLKYETPEGMTLQKINNWVQIGDNIEVAEPQLDPFSVEVTRLSVIERLTKIRDENIENGVTYQGNCFYTDLNSQNLIMQDILTEINGISEVFPTLWLSKSGEPVMISLNDAKAIMSAFTIKKKANYTNYMNFLTTINVALDPLSIDITEGWV